MTERGIYIAKSLGLRFAVLLSLAFWAAVVIAAYGQDRELPGQTGHCGVWSVLFQGGS